MPDRKPDSVPLTAEPEAYQDVFTAPLSFAGLTNFMHPAEPASLTAEDLGAGTLIGDVQVVRFIGAGGMGRVYEGIQASTQRTVAVKVIREGIVSAAASRRLAHEAQILGRLSHPGIARIYSAGVARIGRRDTPYFVMEYVAQPQTITSYAVEHRLTRRERVQLFYEVCGAVAHGHERGVVHRDLKPGNILVDAEGRPRVIDFGVAHSTSEQGQATTMHTETGELLGTAQYMAPEQLYGVSAEIDARADVYALGLILYELLTESLPYDVRERPIYEVARVVREVEPKSLAMIDRQLRGDLTAIVATCLDKDRSRRYPSAAALATDLERHLAGVPIVARPPSFIEALAKLANRHRSAVLGLVGVLVALVAGAVGMSIFAVRAERQRSLAAAAVEQARHQLYRADIRSLQSFLESRNVRAAQAIYAETRDLVADPPSLELRCLGAELDESLAVLEPTGGPVVAVAFTGDGHLLEATTVPVFRSQDVMADTEAMAHRTEYLRLPGQQQTITSYRMIPSGGFERLGATRLDVARSELNLTRAGTVTDVTEDGRQLMVTEDGRVVIKFGSNAEDLATLGEVRRLKQIGFTPGLEQVAVLGADGGLALWNGMTGRFIATCRASLPIERFVFSPDGSWLAAEAVMKHSRSEVGLFSSRSGKLVSTLQFSGVLSRRELVMAFSADGSRILVNGKDQTLEIWNVADGTIEHTLSAHNEAVTVAAWSRDGLQIASADRGGRICLWDAVDGNLQHQRIGHVADVVSLAFSSDEEHLASGGVDGTVRIWSRSIHRSLGTVPLPGELRAVAFHPTGRELAVAAAKGELEVWDAAAVERRLVFPLDGAEVAAVCYAPVGSLLAAAVKSQDGTGEIRIWDTDTGREFARLGGFERGVIGAVFSRSADRLVATADDSSLTVWSLVGPKRLWQARADAERSLAKPLAVFGLGGAVVSYKQPGFFDSVTGQQGHRLLRGQIWCQALSPDEQILVRGTAIGRCYLNDCKTGRIKGILVGHTAPVLAAGFSADGRRLVTGSFDGTVRIWDLESMSEIHQLVGHEGSVAMVCFTPDQRRVVTASSDGTSRIWDATLGVELCQFPASAQRPQTVTVSPDGRILVTSETTPEGSFLRLRGLSNAAVTKARSEAAAGPE
jgi:WD40 repeat protein